MKAIKHYILILSVLVFTGCDKDFIEVNTNPYAVTDIDPALLFAGAQTSHLGQWANEHTIVQQFVIPYNQGATLGFNYNADVPDVGDQKWDASFPGDLRNLAQALEIIGTDASRVNLKSMVRIWRAQIYMGLVDTYGDVPYSEAHKAVSDGIFYPKYDDGATIYDNLYTEITQSLAAFNTGADYVSADLFYGTNAENPTTNATDQVAKWKKLGNSLLLRLGMRYSKSNPTKAQSIAAEAFAGGVMTSNDDNAYVKYDGSLYVQGDNNFLRSFSYFNYAAEPFVDQLKNTNDPRAKYMIATFADPGSVDGDPNPDTDLANQFGVPIGAIDTDISAGAPYRGTRGTGLDYSQFNIWTLAAPDAPMFYVTYAQTSLLLAEAAFRGWVAGSAQTYYEDAIAADMDIYSLYPGTTAIPGADVTAYLAETDVLYNATDALELINTQYWVVNIRNGTEAWANFRRSGFPALTPNSVTGDLGAPGFVRRMTYPDREGSANSANFEAASTKIGGNNLSGRVFWDN